MKHLIRLFIPWINGTLTFAFILFFLYTFIAKAHLVSLAREFVSEKTEKYSAPFVETADVAINSALAKKLLSKEQMAAFTEEIKEYQTDPKAYIGKLTGKRDLLPPPPAGLGQILQKIGIWKQKVKSYYEETLARLIFDLRIFSVTNVITAAIALWLSLRSDPKTVARSSWISCLLMGALLYSVWLYIDHMSFFKIMFRIHLGWTYPIFILVAFVALLLDYWKIHPLIQDQPPLSINSEPLPANGVLAKPPLRQNDSSKNSTAES